MGIRGMSYFLWARNSFATGFGRALDLGGTLTEFNRSLTPEQADRLAFKADVLALNEDVTEVERSQGERPSGNGGRR
jgi:hypothetical protein